MHYEELDSSSLATELKTNLDQGLTKKEAALRLEANGLNVLPKAKYKPWYVVFLLALVEPLQIILLLAAVISVIAPRFGHWQDPLSISDFIDFIVIVVIVTIDAILQTVQTLKARKSVAALKSLSKPTAGVIRNGEQLTIDAEKLVIGDIVVLEAGQYIPADLRLFKAADLTIDESALTGESIAVAKDAQPQAATKILANQKNIAFMGTHITNGRAFGVVVATGSKTEMGKINALIQGAKDETTPLEKKLEKFSFWLSALALLIAVIVFVVLYFGGTKSDWSEYLMVAITLAIGLIPESLPAVVSVALSIAVKRMAKENVIVKRLASVETLGSVNVICTDKTGTLTQNKMTVQTVLWNQELVSASSFVKLQTSAQKELFGQALTLPNDSITEGDERIGDPTELALIDYADLMGWDENKGRRLAPRLDEIPFDSKRKLMSTLNKTGNHQTLFTKGALDQLLKICNRINFGGEVVALTPKIRKIIIQNSQKMTDQALRVLGFAYLPLDKKPTKIVENELIFLGAVGMIDPVRPSAVRAIKEAKGAGCRVVMLTGDHVDTALAIAKQLDLATTQYEVMSSEALEKMPDSELLTIIDNIRVFARVNPEHKVRIIKLLQQKNNIVAMTGDGVNDAPSLAIADIGVAMGKGGTDVAKDAADAILTDDHFATIMKGIDQGRNVYQKIRQAIVLLLSFNLANVLTIFILSLISKASPLEAVNFLYLNLIVESCLAIAMGMGPVDNSLLKLPPPKRNAQLLKGLVWSICKIVFFLTITFLGAYALGRWALGDKPEYGTTALFLTMAFAPLWLAPCIKLTNWKASSKIPWLISKPLIYAMLIGAVLNVIVIFVPGLNSNVFSLMGYGSNGWSKDNWWLALIAFGFSFIPLVLTLLANALIFYSYHYWPSVWQRNQRLVSSMVAEDKRQAKERQKRRKK